MTSLEAKAGIALSVPLILASGSSARAELLRRAGLSFEVRTAAVDEAEIKEAFRAEGREAADCAIALAEAKAMRVSRMAPQALVIGADQMLVSDDRWFDKAEDLAEARRHLLLLRGRPHELVSAVCVVQESRRLWHIVDRPSLWMRAVSDEFIDRYLASVGSEILSSVGGYQLEGMGIQLFERISGDFFSILGLPLLPLLAFLRGREAALR